MSIKEIRMLSGLTQRAFANEYRIPLQTLKQWESSPQSASHRTPPEYIAYALERLVRQDIKAKRESSKLAVEYLIDAAKHSKYNASHWMRYLRKVFSEKGTKIEKDDLDTLLKDDSLTMFQKVSLLRAFTEGTPTNNYVLSLNQKAVPQMVNELKRKFAYVEK